MSKFLAQIEGQIKQFAPNAKNIIVKIERDHELYRSKIHMQLPGVVIHAQKKGQTMWEALNLAYEAIVKQIVKLKTKKRSLRKNRTWRWQDPLGPPA